MSTNLTAEQQRALRVARQALAEAEADHDLPPASRRPDAYWVGRLMAAAHDVTDAFPEGGTS